MRVGQDVLSDLRAALGTEWAFPLGTGGYSSGTACGANARRAHALLTASGPGGRLTTLLLKVDERLRAPGASFELGCNVVSCHTGAFLPARVCQHGLLHALEPAADEGDDAFAPGHIEAALAPGGEFHLVAAAEPDLFRSLAREDRLGAPPPRTLAECVRFLED